MLTGLWKEIDHGLKRCVCDVSAIRVCGIGHGGGEFGVASGWSGWLTSGNLGPIREPQQTSEVSENFGSFGIGSDSIPLDLSLTGSRPQRPRLGIATVIDRLFVETCRPRRAAFSRLKHVGRPLQAVEIVEKRRPGKAVLHVFSRAASPASFFVWVVAALWCVAAVAEDQQSPSGFRPRTFALKNAKIVVALGQVIDKGCVVVRDGRVIAVGADAAIPADALVIEADGLHLYPGFIDAGASALFDEVKPMPLEGRSVDISKYALAGMRSDDRNGLTPEFAAGEHLKPQQADLDKYRQAGFVAVHVLPSGRIASGTGAVVNLASLPVREALLSTTTFATMQLSERGGQDYPATLMGVHAHLRQAFLDAERHAKWQKLFAAGAASVERPPVDPAFEAFNAMRAAGAKTVFVAHSRDDHDRALNFAAEHQLRPVIWGGREAYRVIERLKKTETDVIVQVDFDDEPKLEAPKPNENDLLPDLPEPQRVREHKRQDWKERVSGLAALHKAGVRFAISSREAKSQADVLKGVRQAIANGLDRDAALAALTTQPAVMLGLERELGTIEVGKPAYFIAMTGPFDNEHAKVRHVVINGQRYEYNKDAKPVEPTKPGEPQPLQVAGKWAVEIDAADGKLRGELELNQSDRTLSGHFQSDQGDGRLASGKATQDGVEFVVSIGAGDNTIQLKFDTVGWAPPTTTPNESQPNSTTKAVGTAHPTELRGNLKSPFGAATKWSAKRIESAPKGDSAIQLTTIESVEEPKSPRTPTSGSPVAPRQEASVASNAANVPDATQPVNAPAAGVSRSEPATGKAAVVEQPVEFPEDRRARPIQTGGSVFVKGATVLTATGKTLVGHSILVKHGTITAIGPDLMPEPGMLVIDATGRFVMPGIIDTHSHIMISNGLGGVNEATSSIVCEVRVRDVVNSADASEYRALAGGTTTARLLHGSANCIGGQDAVVQLKHGTSAAEHLFPGAHSGVKFALGENVKFRQGRFPNTRLGVEATLNRAFLEALDYRRVWLEYEKQRLMVEGRGLQGGEDANALKPDALAFNPQPSTLNLLPPRRDLRLEALADIINHQKFIHSHCYRADEILMLLRVAESHGIRVWSLQHVLEGYKVAPEIVKHGASCSTFADWWAYKVEAFDAIPHNAALLHEAGANAVIKSDDWELIRHLYLEAAKTIRYGNMPPDAALQTITLNPAKELGLADRLGSIEVGKQADIAIFSGHPFNAFSRCEQTLIAGEVYFSRDRQPTAMSDAGVARSTKPVELKLLKPEERVSKIDLSVAVACPSEQERAQHAVIPSPPSSGERVRVRGPNGEAGNQLQAASSTDSQPSALNPQSSSEAPLTLALSPQSRGEGTKPAHRYAIVGATIHPVDAADIPNGVVVIDGGKIAAVGPETLAVPEGFAVLGATGLHVYPGLIDSGTAVGLTEIGKVRETSDQSEIGQFQPDLRAGIAINPDSELIPVARAGGITTILALPSGGGNMTSAGRSSASGVITGQASIVQLAGWTMPEMVQNMEAGLHINWPGGKDRKQPVEELKRWLKEARLYEKGRGQETGGRGQKEGEKRTEAPLPLTLSPPSRGEGAKPPTLNPQPSTLNSSITDPRYEALLPYIRGEKTVFIEADTKQEIVEALQFAEQEQLKVVLCGVTDGWKVANQIKAAGVAVIVGPVMRKPVEEYDPFDAPYANAGRLHEAGVKLCFRSDSASNSRNVPFEAAQAVAYGLPADVALRGVTLTSAEILGQQDHLGSITVGKLANLILTDGSPLQQTTQVKAAFIKGQAFQPESRQTRFYEKYRARLKQ